MTAKSTEPRGQGRDAVALLVTEFTGARDAEGATVGRERREHRQFVDGAGHVGRPDLERRQMVMSDSQGADGLVADRDAARDLDSRPGSLEQRQEADARWVESDIVERDIRPGQRGRRDRPAGG